MCNKVSKFIVNSVRVYEHFKGDWMLPLWDRELIDFWYKVPYELRYHQRLYNAVLFDEIFTDLGIALKKPGFDDNYPGRIKQSIRSYLPGIAIQLYRRIHPNHAATDPNNLNELNMMIFQELESGPVRPPKEINSTHAMYFLQNLKKR